MRYPLLSLFALLFGGVAAFATVWIVVRPPLYGLWIVAIIGSEWSLWWGVLGLVGAVLGLGALRASEGRRRAVAGAAIVLGLTATALAPLPCFQTLPVARANHAPLSPGRYLFGGLDGPTTATLAPVETVPFVTTEDGQTLRLDVYRPAEPSRPMGIGPRRAALIVVHGGSWSAGDKSDFAHWDRWLAGQGYIVFDVQYRVRPQPNWRTATGDVKCAVGWVRRNAARYGVDPARVALLGRSAGAHLALLAAYTPNDLAFPPTCSAPDPRVRAVVALYGPTDLTWGYRNRANPLVLDTSAVLRRFLGGTPKTALDAYRLASPLTHVGPDTPPTLLFHGQREALVSPRHTEFLAERLQAAGVPHQAVYLPYAHHGFDYHLDGWGSQVVRPVLLRFLREHL